LPQGESFRTIGLLASSQFLLQLRPNPQALHWALQDKHALLVETCREPGGMRTSAKAVVANISAAAATEVRVNRSMIE
jgi:hypothetical protein